MSETIAVQGVYASAVVRDLEAALDWYARLIGRAADDQPIPGMAQWRDIGGAGLQLWAEPEHAGHSRMTIVVPVMVDERARLAKAGIVLGEDLVGDWGVVAQLIDPDGNRITLAEPPKGFAG